MKLLLQRYLAAQFIMPLLVSSAFFICFLLTFELFRLMEVLVTRDISFMFVLGLIGNIALTFIPLSLPIAVFFSIIYCLNRISLDSEYIAMRAGGMTKGSVLIPFLFIAAILTISVFQLNQNIIPASNKSFRQKVSYLASSGLLAGIKEGQFFTSVPNVTMFATHSTKYGRNLREVFLHLDEPQGGKERVVFAERGELKFERNPETLTEKLTLNLFNGNIVVKDNVEEVEKIHFEEYVFPISQSQFKDSFEIKETMLSSKELKEVLKMTPKQAREAYDFNAREFFNAKYEYWNRINGALVCLVFSFVGFSLGITGTRGKKNNSGLIALVCLILYYSLFFSLVSLARGEKIPIPLAVFSPTVLMVGLGLYFYKKLDWQS
ncbi:MAG TPA: LptF/LptG family permease [Bacteriovoracaceae bacterium]|nr:LptF/LptG family permease [Bacteriovoracaceae bacterium]